MKKVTQLLIIGFSVAALAACAKKHPNGAAVGEGGGASAYSANGSDNFQYDSNGMRINPLTAPANQTYYFEFDSSNMRPQYDD